MKKCKSCQTEIDDKATKCPNCKADQRNWFRKHKIMSVILGLVVLVIIVAAAGGKNSSQNNNAGTSSKSGSSASKPLPKIGQEASDGKFTFTVNKFSCGEATIGTNPYAQATAQGQFCRMNLTIKNTGGASAQAFTDSEQVLYDASGNKYSADTAADIDAQLDVSNGTWFSSINPGNSVTGDILFDVPKGTTPITAELHDSAFSGGTKVSLQ